MPRQENTDQLADIFKQMDAAIKNSPPLPELDDLPPLPSDVRELVLDRIDAAYREGLFAMTAADYAGLLMAIMPDEFIVPSLPTVPTGAAPRSDERIEVYAARCRSAVSLFHRGDTQPDFNVGIKVRKLGGSAPKIEGWATES